MLKTRIIIAIVSLVTISLSSVLIFSFFFLKKSKIEHIEQAILQTTEYVFTSSNDLIISNFEISNAITSLLDHDNESAKNLLTKSETLAAAYTQDGGGNHQLVYNREKVNLDKDSITALFQSDKSSATSKESNFTPIEIGSNYYLIASLTDFNSYTGILIDISNIIKVIQRHSNLNLSLFINDVHIAGENTKYFYNELTSRSELPSLGLLKIVSDQKRDTFIMAFAQDPSKSLTLLSTVPESQITNTVIIALIKPILLGGLILGLSIAVGTLICGHLTHPIIELTAGVKSITKGEYEKRLRIKTSDEVGTLAKHFNLMSETIQSLLSDKNNMIKKLQTVNLQLDDLNKGLETRVKERTKLLASANDHITAMINSINQGLLIFDRTLTCSKIHSQSCLKLFNTYIDKNKIYNVLNIEVSERETFLKWTSVLFAEKIPFESARRLGPQTLTTNNDTGNKKTIALEYFPMRNDKNQIINIVILATDISDQILTEEQNRKNQDYNKMIKKIIQNQDAFKSITRTFDHFMQSIDDEMSTPEPSKHNLMFSFHTLKGLLGSYYISEIHDLFAELEEMLKKSSKSIAPMISEVKIKWNDLLLEIHESTNLNQDHVKISTKSYNYICQKLSHNPNLLSLLNYYTKKHSLREYFKNYNQTIQDIAIEKNKTIADLKIIDNNIRLSLENYGVILDSMIHIFRNIIDHGVEDQETRLEQDKPAKSIISINATIEDKFLVIKILDDGAGVNIEKLKSKLVENNIIPPKTLESLSHNEIIDFIFHPELSTKNTVDSISGRGVGLSSIREIIQQNNGTIEVRSQRQKGTQFKIKILLTPEDINSIVKNA